MRSTLWAEALGGPLPLVCLGLFWTFSAFFFSELRAAESPPAPALFPANSPSVILSSPVKELSLLDDGILSAVLVGKPLPLKPGLNELMLTAPGHGIRKVRIWAKAGEKRTLEVALQKTVNPIDPVWTSPEKLQPLARLAKRPSICSWFRSKSKQSELCTRGSWLEDVLFAEPGLFPLEDMQSLAAIQELKTYRSLVNQVFEADPEVTVKIEDFYTRRGHLKAVKQLLAIHSLFRGDCPRIHALYVEALQVMEDPSPIALFKGFCAELREKDADFEKLIKVNKAPAPYLYFHLGRKLLPRSPAKAMELAASCLKNNRFDLGCQELALMASAIEKPGGPDYKVQRFTIEEGAFRALLNLEVAIPKGQFEGAFFAVIPLLNSYPQSIEPFLFLSWINAAEKLEGGSSYFDRKLPLGTVLGGTTIDKIIEALEKFDFAELLPPIYRIKISRAPDDPNLWIRLIRAYAKAGSCEAVLTSIQEGSHVLPRYNASLLQTQASCLVELKRYQEALETYQKIFELKPAAWSSSYNLAAVYERMKRLPEAVQLYKKALELAPPPEVKDDIQFKLLDLDTSKSTPTDE